MVFDVKVSVPILELATKVATPAPVTDHCASVSARSVLVAEPSVMTVPAVAFVPMLIVCARAAVPIAIVPLLVDEVPTSIETLPAVPAAALPEAIVSAPELAPLVVPPAPVVIEIPPPTVEAPAAAPPAIVTAPPAPVVAPAEPLSTKATPALVEEGTAGMRVRVVPAAVERVVMSAVAPPLSANTPVALFKVAFEPLRAIVPAVLPIVTAFAKAPVPILTVVRRAVPIAIVPLPLDEVPTSSEMLPAVPAEALPVVIAMAPVPPATAFVLMVRAEDVLSPDWIVSVPTVVFQVELPFVAVRLSALAPVRLRSPVEVDQVEVAPPVRVRAFPVVMKDDAAPEAIVTAPAEALPIETVPFEVPVLI